MQREPDLQALQAYFSEADIEWKPIALTRDRTKGLAAAYLTNRAIMDRLDEACGPENWKNEYQSGPDGGVLCGISVRLGGEWITKWDGSENTDIEPVKGGLSTSMRRAAVQWGLGRYLYRLPMQWVPLDERGRFAQPPRIPSEFLPPGSGDGAATKPPAPPRRLKPKHPGRRNPAPGRPEGLAKPPQNKASGPPEGRQQPDASAPPAKHKSQKGQDAQRPPLDAEDYFMPRDLPF